MSYTCTHIIMHIYVALMYIRMYVLYSHVDTKLSTYIICTYVLYAVFPPQAKIKGGRGMAQRCWVPSFLVFLAENAVFTIRGGYSLD